MQIGAEKAKALTDCRCFSWRITFEKITRKSKDTLTKLFLNSELDVFKAFQLTPRPINTKIMYNLEVFITKI